jgi:hypothetical protein
MVMSNLPDRVLGQKPPLQIDYVSVGVNLDKTIAPSLLALCIKKHAAFLNTAAIPPSEE